MTRRTVKAFSLDCQRFADALEIRTELVVERLAFDTLRGSVLRSPVDEGPFSNSWTLDINGPDTSVILSAPPSAASGQAERMGARLSEFELGDTVFIGNFLPYAETLEFGGYPGDGPKTTGGYSDQAPLGVLRITLAEVAAEFQETAAQVFAGIDRV